MSAVDDLIAAARRELGKPYVYGTEGPNTFDCSGLVTFIFAQIGLKLPHNAAQQQADPQVHQVATPLPGDLVFYGAPATHVGLYIGDGKMIHAPNSRSTVKVADVYGTPTYGRVNGLGSAIAPWLDLTGAAKAGIGETIDKALGKGRDTVVELLAMGAGALLLLGGIWLLTRTHQEET